MDGERFLRGFHATNAGITSRVLARGDSYRDLAARVPAGARVLDLGCGDGHLLALLAARGCTPIGVDLSRDELALAGHPRACARAQALPFAAASFDVAVAHLAFMLFETPEQVVAELDRVLVPGGEFHAVLGGGPTAGGDDAFHRFLAAARGTLQPRRLGDPRARTEAGWRTLFAGWEVDFERRELDLSGPFEAVWAFLASSYELAGLETSAIRSALAATYPDLADVPCRAVTWLARARR